MNFFLFVNESKDTEFAVAKSVADFITKNGGNIYCMTEKVLLKDALCGIDGVHFCDTETCIQKSDIAVVVGGDGTILKAAKLLYGKNVPILGINRGTVGYMAELEANEYELLGDLFRTPSVMTVDERMMLKCSVERDGSVVFSDICLNEAVVAKGDISRMIDIELDLDGKKVAGYQCDGIIASTPTGSTAYSMSAGGAIIDPGVECISVIPLCAYLCINSSPIIFSKESKIVLTYKRRRENIAYVSTDGTEGFKLKDGDRVIISSAEHTTKLLKLKNTDFCRLLNAKLTHRASEIAEN